MTVTVIIPTYKPDGTFQKLIEKLKTQTYPIKKILILNTEAKYWKEDWIKGIPQAEVHHITKEEFDHGKTRAMGAAMAETDLLVFFTQDAVPANNKVIEVLVNSFADDSIGAAYGRQLPAADCKFIEQYTRGFNYPENSRVKRKEDLPKLGIKTYFCSNVCAAYRRCVYEKLGGFVTKTIFNEDMILAAQMIQAGYGVAYAARAEVIHSHNYSYFQQFQRNFDLAVSQADHPEIFAKISSESEGMRLVKQTASYLLKQKKPWLIPDLVLTSGFKFLGYKAGQNYQKLPKGLVKKFTMNPSYWE
ncbi:MAG: glycosyltransferase family 2 protein [Firmicutes bacterium]|nr:glycosyltransferase family 2 protein [Bacillota bacterium]